MIAGLEKRGGSGVFVTCACRWDGGYEAFEVFAEVAVAGCHLKELQTTKKDA